MNQTRTDGYVNMMNKYGTTKDSSTAYQYQHDYYTSDTLLTDQYSGNGLFARIIDAPADEAVKHGFTLTIENEEITKYIIDQLEMLDWEDAFATAEKWSRLYGGAIIVMLADDGGRLEEPLNIQQTRSIDALYVFERAVVTPNYDGLSDYGFSKPNSFSVSSIAGAFTVHSSRCLIFRNGKLPELVPDLNYRYFGFPEYHRIKQQLRETVTSHSYASKLLERSVQPVHKIKDLASMMSTQDGEEEILKRLDLVDTARGIMNTIAIDADGEDYAFQTFSFTGVQEIIDVHCNILSAVTSIPQTILFGRSPAGMNATGYSDFENYYNMIEHIQKRNMKGNLRTLINLIIRQGKACGEILGTVGDFKIEFNPLWNLSETEQAQVAAQKMSTASAKATVAQTYIDLGVLDPTEVRATLKTDDIFAIDDSLDAQLEEFDEEIEEFPEECLPKSRNDGIIMKEDEFKESDHPRDEGGRFSEGSGNVPSGKGKNSFTVKGFVNKQKLNNHWQNGRTHQEEYKSDGITTKEAYVERAVELIQSPCGETIDGYKNAKNEVVRYDIAKNDFVKGNPEKGIITMFKPLEGKAYFDRLKQIEGVDDDDEK